MLLEQFGITLAGTVPEGPISDTVMAFVWKQYPEAVSESLEGDKIQNYIQSGQIMDLWISQTMIYPQKDTTKER